MSRVVPLLNIWSEYSLLRSTWRIEPGLAHLRDLGYHDVGLADWETLAGAELFDRAARQNGLTPWIGVSLLVNLGTSHRTLLIYATDTEGWRHLSSLMQKPRPIRLEEAASPHVIVVWLDDVGTSEPIPSRLFEVGFFEVVEGLWPPDRDKVAPTPRRPWVPACPVRYIRASEQESYEMLGQIGNHADHPRYPRVPPVAELMAEYPDTWWASCLSWRPQGSVLPERNLKLPAFARSSAEEVRQLRDKVRAGVKTRYPVIHPAVTERIDRELSVIETMGFAGYFLIVEDLVTYAQTAGIRVGPGRGSAAGSLVAYALGITAIDPLAHGLIFERFLNPARRTMPDIDLDFDVERRGEILEYLRRRWGSDRVAQIGTYGTLGGRAVVRDVGKALNMDPAVIDRTAAQIPIGNGVAAVGPLLDQYDPSGRWRRVTTALEGLVRHGSTHAAGVIIAPSPLDTWIPCHRDDTGRLITQMEMASLERMGFLKLDILGLRTLTVIRQIEEEVGLTEEFFRTLDPEDLLTLDSLGKGDTEAVFQLDGTGVIELLRSMRPRSLEEVMTVVALYRPGPMENIGLFLDRRRGIRPIPDDPVSRLVPETYGIVVYQEQLMLVIRELAGYSWAEADMFRRAISKKDRDLLDRERDHFVRALGERGMATEAQEALWHQIMSFADYGFNKSHAAAYGTLSYYVAFLRAHYPLEFWSAELSSLSDTARLQHTVDVMAARGIALYPPDVNVSGMRCCRDGAGVRVGLNAIRGLSPDLAHRIIDSRRRDGIFLNVLDFMKRLRPLGEREMDIMQAAGVLSGLPGQPWEPTQLSLFESEESTRQDSSGLDVEASLGWKWPEAVGPLYVRLDKSGRERQVAAAIQAVGREWPGDVSVVLARDHDRGFRLEHCALAASGAVIDLVRGIPGVLACGRRVEHRKFYPSSSPS